MQWARAYVEFAAEEKRSWLAGHGLSFLPTVGWAERGDLRADGHGNSVPRFHVTWGTGTGVVEPFVRSRAGGGRRGARHLLPPAPGRRTRHHRRRRDRRARHGAGRGRRGRAASPSNRDTVGEFELSAQVVIVTTGGIGANHDLVRRYWPAAAGHPAGRVVTGVPAYVDGRMLDIAARRGRPARQPRPDVALHRGPAELEPDLARPRHPHPARTVVDLVRRARPATAGPVPARLRHARHAEVPAHRPRTSRAYDHSWFILTQKIIEKEFALSGLRAEPRHHRQEPARHSCASGC